MIIVNHESATLLKMNVTKHTRYGNRITESVTSGRFNGEAAKCSK
jgi:hypothetical protein